MRKWLTVGVDVSNGRALCRGCERKIAEGEKRFFYLGYEYRNKPCYFYWHPKCFLEFAWDTVSGGKKTGREVLADILEAFLPLLIGEEEAMPIVLSLKMARS